MKRNKWQRLAAIGLCSSLLVNAFSGVTAVAETVTIESSPTAESSAKEETPASSVKEETTKASTENSQVTTDTSQEEVEQTEKTETTESANVATDLVGEQENEVISIPEVKSIQPKAAVAFPAKTFQFGFVNEAGQLINPVNIPITYSYAKGSQLANTSPLKWTMSPGSATNTGNLKSVTMPATTINDPVATGGNEEVYANVSIQIPRYYASMSLYNKAGRIDANYPLPSVTRTYIEGAINSAGRTTLYNYSQASLIEWLGLRNRGNNSYTPKDSAMSGDPAQLKFPLFMHRANRINSSSKTFLRHYYTMDRPVYYHLTNRRVTENFVDTNGAKITPPSNFTQGKQTVINSDPYTFQQSGFLPETYKVGTKSYRFKGWYKGKTKTEPLATTKTPNYKVTYDDNDDLTVVYEEFSGYELPASTNQFGFVDEATNKLIAPDQVQMKYNLTLNENNKKTVMSSNLTGTDTATLKNLSVPVNYFEQYRVNTFYGASDITFTLPKRYKSINITKSDGKTDPAFPIPKIYNKDQVEMSHMPVTTYNKLKQLSGQTFGFNALADQPEFYTKMLFGTESGIDDPINYYTMSGPVYYYLENRKVIENFVDTNGAKITPPTGFTQGKKTAITSDAYTFKQAGTLPDTYTTGGKTYKFKGWYKGKTKTEPLTTTKAPSYGVTYDDNDDLNVVYEETKEKTTTIPAVTYKFGFVDEKGALVAPTNFNMTTNLTTVMNGTPKQVGTASGVNNGNLKQLTIPSQQLTYTPTVNPAFSGATNFRLTVPKQYKLPTVTPGTYYTGSSTAYPVATRRMRYVDSTLADTRIEKDGKYYSLYATTKANEYRMYYTYWLEDKTTTQFASILTSATTEINVPNYYTTNDTMYYFLENRRVTENFVDTSGAKITPPTGFTQGKKTAITSDSYTFKQAGTLPETYTTGGKTYKFKGWYKGKSILNTLTTTKAPSYQVTYDDNDDLNVVYEEETVTTFYPSVDMNFVDEKGVNFTPALTFSGKYYAQSTSDNVINNLYDVTSKNNGNGQYTLSVNNGSIPLSQELLKKYNNGLPISSTNRLRFHVDKLTIDQQLKYVDGIQIDTAQSSPLNYYGYKYTSDSSTIFDPNIAPIEYNMTTEQINSLNFSSDGTYFSNANNRFFNMNLGYSSSGGSLLLIMTLFNENPTDKSKLVYKVTRKQVTENFVDANGAKITAPTGFTQGNQVPMNSNTFKYTAAKALPATYTAGGKTYTFQGWYKGKTKPSTLNKTTTPTFNATFDGNDDMTAMYKEEIPTASVTLTRPKEVIDTNTNVIWTTTITNTSKAPLQNLTLKKGPNWSAGLTIPTFMEVTPEGETTKSIPVNSTLWTEGVPLPNAVPIGKKVSVAFTTRATGKPNTVLKAEVVVFGGIKDRTVDNFVRIRPNDQEVVTPTTEGFISVPTFDFGQVGVAGSKQQHNLKQAADYYGNGTRNPYVRIKKTQPNWSLTAQLSQPKSATDSLPTATRLLLGAAPVSSFTNYNQPTELKNAVGTTSAISLTANNTATSIIANKQFTGSNVYQLDFTFNNVKLEVPANQGVKGRQYKAAVTWNLVTGP
ncbi:WxL domain-containing protein [Enterococcus faecalis]|uniref:WxL domain-containing protein n=2 Tax=Enterococcus faecalis TaxID=1351 RepID=UPI003A97D65C